MKVERHTNTSTVSLGRCTSSLGLRVCAGVLTCVAVLYATTSLLLTRLASVVSALLATMTRMFGFDRIFRRNSTAITAVVLAESGIIGLAWFPRITWVGISISMAVFVALLAISISGTRRALELPRGLDEIKVPRSSFERLAARYVANPLDAVFVRLTVGISAVILPSFAGVLVPVTCSPYVMVLYVLLMMTCAEPFELVDHTNMHNRVFFANRDCSTVSRTALRCLALWQEYGLTLAMTRIPHRYRVQHLYVHHIENNGPTDPQSTIRYDRTSYFAFSRFALKMGVNSTFPWGVSRYLFRVGRYRALVVLHANLLGYVAFLIALTILNLPAAILIIALRFSSGTGATLLNFYEHGLIDPSDVQNLYRNAVTIAILHENEHGSLGNDFHVAHHAHPGRHWSQLIEEARASVALYGQKDAIVFRDARAVVRNLLRRRFDALAAQCELNGRSPSALAQELQRRAGQRLEGPNVLARRLDHWFGEFAGRFLIEA